jgi:hypothetical protein
MRIRKIYGGRSSTLIAAGMTIALSALIGGAATSPPNDERARAAFLEVAKVLKSPRCQNCHPDGNAPLQHDTSQPHRMAIRRDIERLGLSCETCHQATNLLGAHMPPGAPHWRLPTSSMPMVFQNRTPGEICRALKDPAKNGNRSLSDILHHVTDDAIVNWAWKPGEGRTTPPLSHDEFVRQVTEWVNNGAACPE